MMMKEDIKPSEEMNMTSTTMTERMKRCIRHIPSISSFPVKTALITSTDTKRTYMRWIFYYLLNHGPPLNMPYIMDMNCFSLLHTYYMWTYKQTNWTKDIHSMNYLSEYGSETDFAICRNENTVSSFFAALRLEDLSNHQAMWEEAHYEIAKEKIVQQKKELTKIKEIRALCLHTSLLSL